MLQGLPACRADHVHTCSIYLKQICPVWSDLASVLGRVGIEGISLEAEDSDFSQGTKAINFPLLTIMMEIATSHERHDL